MSYDGHTTWCSHRGTDEKHDPEYYAYCYRQINGVRTVAEPGEQFPGQLWVYATSPANPDALENGERAADDYRYEGVELTHDHNGAETTYRLSSPAARSLAAALTRAADIQEGLAR